MRPRSLLRARGRRPTGTFSLIPHDVQDSVNWRQCGGTAIKLLLDLARQYNGHNNGNLVACRSVLGDRGWHAPETLHFAVRELEHYGFLERTKQGGLFVGPNLFALTWHAIDECGGRLPCRATVTASGLWKNPQPKFKRPARSSCKGAACRSPMCHPRRTPPLVSASTPQREARYGKRTS